MMNPRTDEAKVNLRQGIQKMDKGLSAAQKIARKHSAGAPRRSDAQKSHVMAVSEALAYREEIVTSMRAANLDPADLRVGIIFTPEDVHKTLEVRVQDKDMGLEAVQKLREYKGTVMGLLFELQDRERNDRCVWARVYVADKARIGDILKLEPAQ
jgi:hypothetical protein